MSKSIIFHIPWSINKNRPSASQIRPLKMLEAFKSLGYDVDIVMGDAEARESQINLIKEKIKQGKKYLLLYSESSTYPTTIADGTKQALTHPLIDYRFLIFCKKKEIPIGLFYRDIHWKFPQFSKGKFFPKRWALNILHKLDIPFYERYVDVLYLPTIKMLDYLNTSIKKVKELPPGCEIHANSNIDLNGKLNIVYVGGIGKHYEIEKLLNVVSKNPKTKLTICCRLDDWTNNSGKYERYLNSNICVVHKSGKQLQTLYEKSDITSLFWEPEEYMSFAMPMKLFEYIGYHKPIIATIGTSAGEFVTQNDIGWTLRYDENELEKLLNTLLNDKEEISSKIKQIEKFSLLNTWEMRANQVVKDLVNC